VQKWEYDVGLISLDPGPPPYLNPLVGGPNEMLATALNWWGDSGWELISIVPVNETNVRAIFKRPIVEETPEQRKERVESERLKRRARGRLFS
jgi:hypothetical protein